MAINIECKTIPASEQRYNTCGDYWTDAEVLHFRVNQMSDWRSEAAVFLHEFVEKMLTIQRNIDEKSIDRFDMYEYQGSGEPGDDPDCPYRNEHRTAENLERLFIEALGMHWDEHTKLVDDSCQ